MFTVLAAGFIPSRLLPVEFIEGEQRAKRLCKSLAIEFPHLIFSHEAWAAERLEEPPASISMASGAFKGAYGDEAQAVVEAARSMVMFMGGRGLASKVGKSPGDKGSRSSPPNGVSPKTEKEIKDAMLQLGFDATTKEIAVTAGVCRKTVRRSKAWKNRVAIPISRPSTSCSAEDSVDRRLDVEAFIEVRKPGLHHRTRAKLERLLSAPDLKDRIIGHLIDAERQLARESNGERTLATLEKRVGELVIRSVIESASQVAADVS